MSTMYKYTNIYIKSQVLDRLMIAKKISSEKQIDMKINGVIWRWQIKDSAI